MSFPNIDSGEKKPAPKKQKTQHSSEFPTNDYLRPAGGYSGWNSEAPRPVRPDREEALHGTLKANSLPYAPEASYQQGYHLYDPYYSRYHYDYNFNESGYSYQDPDRYNAANNPHSESPQLQQGPKRGHKGRTPNSYLNQPFEPAVANNGQQFYHLNNQSQHHFKQQTNRNKNAYPAQPPASEQQPSFNEGQSQTHETSQSAHPKKKRPHRKKELPENAQNQAGFSDYQVKDASQPEEFFTGTEAPEKKPNRRPERQPAEPHFESAYGRSGPKYQGTQTPNPRPQYNSQTSRKPIPARSNAQTKPNPTVKTHNHFSEKFVWQINTDFFEAKELENDELLTREQAMALLEQNKAFIGKCKSKENIHYSILIECPEHFPRELSVKTKNLNYRALDGCEVVFSVHQQPEGKKEEKPDQPPEEQAAQGRSVRRKDGERQMAKVLFVLKSPFEGRMSILKISRDLHGGPNKYIGRCVYKKKYPEFTIEEESLSKFQGKLADHYYVAQYKEWDPMKKAPLIRLVEPIGSAGAIPVEFQCLAKTLNVELQGFSFEEEDAVAEECAQMLAHKYEFDPEHFQDRFDLSNMLAISVGSKHAQAASVAFSVVDKGEGKLELGVHTPDLTYYVKPGSQADLLAKARLNSASLPHKHFGMLPDFLEQGPCSLVPGSSRLATSLYFLIDDQGEIVPGSTKLFKTIIQVSAFIPFELAADIAEGQLADFPADFVSFNETAFEDVRWTLSRLHRVAGFGRSARLRLGLPNMRLFEKKCFSFSPKTGKPAGWDWSEDYFEPSKFEEILFMADRVYYGLLCERFPGHPQLLPSALGPSKPTAHFLKQYQSLLGTKLDLQDPACLAHAFDEILSNDRFNLIQKSYLHSQLLAWLECRRFWGGIAEEAGRYQLLAANYPFPRLFTTVSSCYLSLVAQRCYFQGDALPALTAVWADRSLKQNLQRVAEQLCYLFNSKSPVRTHALLVSIKKGGLIFYLRELGETYLYSTESRFDSIESDEKTYIKLTPKQRDSTAYSKYGKARRTGKSVEWDSARSGIMTLKIQSLIECTLEASEVTLGDFKFEISFISDNCERNESKDKIDCSVSDIHHLDQDQDDSRSGHNEQFYNQDLAAGGGLEEQYYDDAVSGRIEN